MLLHSHTQRVSELLQNSLKFSSSQELCTLRLFILHLIVTRYLKIEFLHRKFCTKMNLKYVLKNVLTIELFAYQVNCNGRCEYFYKFFDYFQSVECFSMHSLKVDCPYFVSNANSTDSIGRTSRDDVSYFHQAI